jgi:hypothetical protein
MVHVQQEIVGLFKHAERGQVGSSVCGEAGTSVYLLKGLKTVSLRTSMTRNSLSPCYADPLVLKLENASLAS